MKTTRVTKKVPLKGLGTIPKFAILAAARIRLSDFGPVERLTRALYEPYPSIPRPVEERIRETKRFIRVNSGGKWFNLSFNYTTTRYSELGVFMLIATSRAVEWPPLGYDRRHEFILMTNGTDVEAESVPAAAQFLDRAVRAIPILNADFAWGGIPREVADRKGGDPRRRLWPFNYFSPSMSRRLLLGRLDPNRWIVEELQNGGTVAYWKRHPFRCSQ